MQRKNRFSMGVTLAAAILFLGSLSSASSQLESGFVKAVPKVTMEGAAATRSRMAASCLVHCESRWTPAR
mgnify:CR=1 FL=1